MLVYLLTAAVYALLLTSSPSKASEATISVALIRTQFPVQLAFALSIHKCQGATYRRVGLLLPNCVFSHGQLYVALSRVGRADAMKVVIVNTPTQGVPPQYRESSVSRRVFTRNVVYEDIFANYVQTSPPHVRRSLPSPLSSPFTADVSSAFSSSRRQQPQPELRDYFLPCIGPLRPPTQENRDVFRGGGGVVVPRSPSLLGDDDDDDYVSDGGFVVRAERGDAVNDAAWDDNDDDGCWWRPAAEPASAFVAGVSDDEEEGGDVSGGGNLDDFDDEEEEPDDADVGYFSDDGFVTDCSGRSSGDDSSCSAGVVGTRKRRLMGPVHHHFVRRRIDLS